MVGGSATEETAPRTAGPDKGGKAVGESEARPLGHAICTVVPRMVRKGGTEATPVRCRNARSISLRMKADELRPWRPFRLAPRAQRRTPSINGAKEGRFETQTGLTRLIRRSIPRPHSSIQMGTPIELAPNSSAISNYSP